MKSHEIEGWARRVIESAKSGQPNEDFRVELKSAWIPPEKAARRIAAHANAARGEDILWIMGVDSSGNVKGADDLELANWYEQVKAEFDDRVTPQLTNLNIRIGEATIVALLFDTSGAPYVVKAKSSAQFEVPWRENNSTRSAGRAELLKILSPIQRLPECEVRSGLLAVTPKAESELSYSLVMELYVILKNDNQVVIPFHKCETAIIVCGSSVPLSPVSIMAMKSATQFRISPTEIAIDGPGTIYLRASGSGKGELEAIGRSIDTHIQLSPANMTHPIVIEWPVWILGKPPGLKQMTRRTRNQLPARRRSSWSVRSW